MKLTFFGWFELLWFYTELPKELFCRVNAPAVLSALCHKGFDTYASLEFERWREFIFKAKQAARRVV